MAELLTDAEHRAMDLTTQLWNVLATEVVGDMGGSRAGDLRELGAHLHAIQQAVLSQAAGRAYPNRYRLLGRALAEPSADGRPGARRLTAMPARVGFVFAGIGASARGCCTRPRAPTTCGSSLNGRGHTRREAAGNCHTSVVAWRA